MLELKDFISQTEFSVFQTIETSAEKAPYISGLSDSAKALYIAQRVLRSSGCKMVICNSALQAELILEDLSSMLGDDKVQLFPSLDLKPYEWKIAYGIVREQRMQVFERLYRKEELVIVTTLKSIMEKLPSSKSWHKEVLQLKVEQELEISDLRKTFLAMGFVEESMVENIGEFSVRGGIVDVYPMLCDQPLRIDFFGNEVETIREFDIFTQRSKKNLEKVDIFPMDECVLSQPAIERGLSQMKKFLSDGKNNLNKENQEKLVSEENRMLVRGEFNGIHWQRAFFQDLDYSIFELLGDDAEIFLHYDGGEQDLCGDYLQNLNDAFQKATSDAKIVCKPKQMFFKYNELQERLGKYNRCYFSKLVWDGENSYSFDLEEQQRANGGLSDIENTLEELNDKNFGVWLISPNEGQAERLKSLVSHLNFSGVLVGSLNSGFVLEQEQIALLTDHQIFNRFSRRIKKYKTKGGVAISSIEALENGDYVIHENHGIGQYLGLTRVEHDSGSFSDYILLKYDKGGRIRIPISGLNRLEKFSSNEDEAPQLHTIGGKRWNATKKKAKKSVVKIAKELIELYAKRQKAGGFPFPVDATIQNEFENAFGWEPTPDQMTATQDVKNDMEKAIAMDRLVCGDVGFGKTEVAMRAAFKAVSAKKQVAILVPTTILAAQHYDNFLDRFSGWPVNIEMVSRYRSAKEKKEIFNKVKEGKMDILIGTHALLSESLEYKDLGLLIIDEEQKFGVKQKEKIREIKFNVDTLCMTATPIPRTLHLSLTGARDISLITTPPRNRLPIETRVLERDDSVLAEAMAYELERGGQVFVVHDRVMSIGTLAEEIEVLVPQARVGVAHGQMNEKDLEQVMSAFMHREFDILVCTSIIESGLDVPSANTIIINNAHNFGVSQLYQMRGRVGRSSTSAKAFLLTPMGMRLADNSKERLEALEKFTDLGSGYKLAMRDLEIRGAGNMLGTQQHGFIMEVGYETYMRMVKEAMAEIQGEEYTEELQPQLEFPVDAYLPEDYILDGLQRISIYQKIARISTLEQVKELSEELQDRYGDIPKACNMLLEIAKISTLCKQIGIAKIEVKKQQAILTFVLDRTPQALKLAQFMGVCKNELRFLMTEPLQIVMSMKTNITEQIIKGVTLDLVEILEVL